jgi:hypothetical protein
MNVKELRYGNYIIVRDSENDYNVWDGDFEPDDCFPIPLNEKWLLSFGFEKKGPKYIKGNFAVFDYGHIYGFDVSLDLGCNFKYVHKLQNLYYALEDKELTIKELSNGR